MRQVDVAKAVLVSDPVEDAEQEGKRIGQGAVEVENGEAVAHGAMIHSRVIAGASSGLAFLFRDDKGQAFLERAQHHVDVLLHNRLVRRRLAEGQADRHQ